MSSMNFTIRAVPWSQLRRPGLCCETTPTCTKGAKEQPIGLVTWLRALFYIMQAVWCYGTQYISIFAASIEKKLWKLELYSGDLLTEEIASLVVALVFSTAETFKGDITKFRRRVTLWAEKDTRDISMSLIVSLSEWLYVYIKTETS